MNNPRFQATLIFILLTLCFAKIYDPLNIFCGDDNCYDLLGLNQDASIKDIKKAYRKVSLALHPDKNKEANATESFQVVTKAYEVLTGNESKKLFDYYLNNPRDYFKVSGQHYYKNLPKSDVRIVIAAVIGLLTWFFYVIQYQKYERVVKYLKFSTLNNLNIKNGGTRQTIELHRRASELYTERLKESNNNTKGSKGSKISMLKDPLFESIVDEVVATVEIEGGYRKPEWKDLFFVQCMLIPYNVVTWGLKYHRRYISTKPLPWDDKVEMAKDRMGLFMWEEYSEEEKKRFIDMEIWKNDVHERWRADQEAEDMKKQKLNKLNKSSKRRSRNQPDEDYDEYAD